MLDAISKTDFNHLLIIQKKKKNVLNHFISIPKSKIISILVLQTLKLSKLDYKESQSHQNTRLNGAFDCLKEMQDVG